ncbi:MAG TPA: CPBP family intramembrane glutamic endopeptidase [Allosphingosinicella sp.]
MNATLAQAARLQPDRSVIRQTATFLAIVALAEAALTVAMQRVDPSSTAAALVMVGIMWAPGLAALGVQLAFERTLRGFGWKPGPARYFGAAYAMPFLYGGLCLLAAQALGAGEINFDRWAAGAPNWGMPPHALYGMLIQMTVFLLPGIVMGLGEELGWRGFLAPKLGRLFSFWGVVNVSFVIWLAFHLPGMVFGGYHGQGTPLWYSFLCFSALLYPGTVLLTWLRFRSNSLWPCVLYHGAHNAFIQIMWNSAFRPDETGPWLLGEFGAVTPVVFGLLLFLLVRARGVPRTPAHG